MCELWIVYTAIIIEIGLTISAFYLLWKLQKNKFYYPIKQLSPTITLLQGLSFYFCQLFLVILSLLVVGKNDLEDCESISKEPVGKYYVLFSFLYLYSRGCSFGFTFLKSLRVVQAFKGHNLHPQSRMVMLCKNEELLSILGLIYGYVGFPIVTFGETLHQKFPDTCSLMIYENNSGIVMLNSLVEELLTIYLLYAVDYQRISDKLVKLTVDMQFIYVLWFSFNSIIDKYWNNAPLLILQIIQISCWIRCWVMFYGFIYQPISLKEEHPTIYITAEQVGNFKVIISKQFNRFYISNEIQEIFLQYLAYLDATNFINTDFSQSLQNLSFEQTKLFETFEQLQDQLLSGEDHFRGNDKFSAILQINHQSSTFLENRNFVDSCDFLFKHFENIYNNKFKNSQSFKKLNEFYSSNEIVQQNLQLLKMRLDQFIPYN